jgi:hypothetical protein
MRIVNGLKVFTHDEAVDMLSQDEPKPDKDTKSAFRIILSLAIAVILAILLFSCSKKESFSVYTVRTIERPGTFACKITARSPGKPDLVFYEECGKYKVNQTFKVEF